MNELAWLTPCLYVYERYFPVEWTEREIFWTSSVKPSNHQWALTARQHMFRDIHKGLMMACHRELTHVSLADACDTSMSILMRFTHRLVLLFPPLLTSTGKAGREKQQQTLRACVSFAGTFFSCPNKVFCVYPPRHQASDSRRSEALLLCAHSYFSPQSPTGAIQLLTSA